MPHTYATVAEANDYIISNGAAKAAVTPETAGMVALKLGILESVSRRIDSVCHRSRFGTGFGPRVGTNKYDGDGTTSLLLRDDLLSTTAFTIAPVTSGTGVSPVVDTDYFLAVPGDYSGPPYRSIVLTGIGSPTYYGPGLRTVVVTGTWGYSDVTIPNATTVASGLSVGTTATTFTTSATPTISPGNTLLIGTERLYLYALSTTTATVVRGAYGSTAATHADASAIAVQQYDSRVHDVCLRLFMRRWKARDAGADGTSGGLEMPGQVTTEGEDLIIRRGLSDLLLLGTY